MSAKDDVDALLGECGAVLQRHKKHEVWLLPNGQSFTRSKTPSDYRAEHRNLSDLKHALGTIKTVATVGERRERQRTAGAAAPRLRNRPLSLREQLITTGVVEESLKVENVNLRQQVAQLRTSLKAERQQLNLMLLVNRAYLHEQKTCLGCRVRRWVRHRFVNPG